jgi:hypothetical protein
MEIERISKELINKKNKHVEIKKRMSCIDKEY